MIFLTAIPDDYYFTWQLELQLYNFKKLGIAHQNIQVLIGYNTKKGIQNFIQKHNDKAQFFIYPDSRKKKQYPSSIRPHIIWKHFKANPHLEREIIFYYDTDIIFRELPDFKALSKGNTWYVSDTRNYLDSNYIKNTGAENLFKKMCDTVGIPSLLVENNDIHCGGAQYILKNVPLSFWRKVEKDCEALYSLMQAYNNHEADKEYIQNKKKRSEYHGIQAWCADMWAILWNAWLFGFNVKIYAELDFCWTMDSIEQWNNKKILHYSGSVNKENKRFFRKGNYIKYPPYYDYSLKKIRQDNCSFPLAQLINDYRNELDKNRLDAMDISFLIPVRIDSQSRLENILYVTRYLNKYLKTNIIIAEADKEQKIDASFLPSNCTYSFLYDDNPLLFRTKVNNWLIQNAKTKFISIYDTDVIIPVEQITVSLQMLRDNNCDIVYPYDGAFVSIDILFKEMFGKILDTDLLPLNANKFPVGVKRSCGGCVFIDREKYIAAGMENENFTSWGPEDIERNKRMRNLGYSVKRVAGNLYHLPHDRLENSSYATTEHRIQFMEEYLKICRMKKTDLKAYVQTWSWANKTNIYAGG